MKEAGSYHLQNASFSLTFFRAMENQKRFMDEVIGVTNGYGCGNRRKSGTVGYLLNQSKDEPSTTTTGGEAKLRRQLRFLVASFWRLASQAGYLVSKLPSASVKSLSIIGRNGGEGGPPYFKGGISPFHSRSSTTTFRLTKEDRELRRQEEASHLS